MKKIIALFLSVLMLISCVGCKNDSSSDSDTTDTPKVNKDHALSALKTENFEISCGMLSYLYLYGFYNVYGSYGVYFDNMGFDAKKPLDEQQYGEDMTWHEYFLQMTMSDAKTFLYVAEAAKADNFPIESYEEKAEKALVDMTTESGMTEEEYLEKMFGSYLDRNDLISALTLQLYAYDYYDSIGKKAQNDVSDEECEKYYEENAKTFNKVDYIFYTVTANTANTDDTEAAYNEAKLEAEQLLATANEKGIEGFKSWVTDYMKKTNAESTTPMEEDALASQIEKTLAGVTGVAYSENNELSQWAFEEGRAEGDAKITDNGAGSYTVNVISKTPYRDEAVTKNVRHILFKPESYENADAAKAKAEDILEEWKAGEATEESFDALSEKYNDDSNCLYENVSEGDMVQAFNDWLFDGARKPGDTGIVETNYGYHIMYFVSDGKSKWKNDVVNTLANQTLNELLTSFQEDYKITEYEENIEKLPKLIPEKALDTSDASSYIPEDVPDNVNVY